MLWPIYVILGTILSIILLRSIPDRLKKVISQVFNGPGPRGEFENVLPYDILVRALTQHKKDLARINERPIINGDEDKGIR